jgi:gamma-glutamyltranspeptidase/glutathione hydrolase
MCPTVVLRGGRPVLAVGATGGRRIPNTLIDVLARYVGRDRSMEEAVAAPRLHTEGGLDLTMEAKWPEAARVYLEKVGYRIKTGPGATVQAVSFDPQSGACRSATR